MNVKNLLGVCKILLLKDMLLEYIQFIKIPFVNQLFVEEIILRRLGVWVVIDTKHA